MGKRVYRAISIKRVNISKLEEFCSGQRIVFAVDAAKVHFMGAFHNEEGQIGLTIKWKSPTQVGMLLDLLKELPASQIEAVMEPTGTYGDALRYQLGLASIPVYMIGAKRCHDASEVYDGVPSSHDAKSAAIIGKLHLDGLSHPWLEKTAEHRELAAELGTLDIYQSQRLQNTNRLEAKLARYWPELPELVSLKTSTLLGVLRQYGSPANVASDEAGAIKLMGESSRGMLKYNTITAVVESAKRTIGVPMDEAEVEALKVLAEEVKRNRSQERLKRNRIRQLTRSSQSTCTGEMVRTVGPVTASVLLVELGSAQSYDSAAAYVKAAGLNLKERSSGSFKGRLKITKRGSGMLRRYLFLAVLRMIQRDRYFFAWYHKKVARDGGLKLKAVTALMRKLLKALWHVGRGATFDTRRLFNVRRLRMFLPAETSSDC